MYDVYIHHISSHNIKEKSGGRIRGPQRRLHLPSSWKGHFLTPTTSTTLATPTLRMDACSARSGGNLWPNLHHFTLMWSKVPVPYRSLQYLLVRTCRFVSDFGMSLGIGLQLFNCLRCRAQDTHTIPTWLFFAASREAMTAARTSSSLGTTKRGLLSRAFLQRTFQSRTVQIEYGHA